MRDLITILLALVALLMLGVAVMNFRATEIRLNAIEAEHNPPYVPPLYFEIE